MSVFQHKTQFTSEQLACAIVGVTDWKEKRDEVRLWEEEIDLAFPPAIDQKRFSGYGGGEFIREEKKYPAISREQALAFCEQHGLRPSLLFPDDPPALPAPADSSQFKEPDLLVTIYRLMLLVKDLDKELDHVAKYKRRRYERGSGISNNAVWEDIAAVLKRLGISATGLGSTKTREILGAACQIGAAVPEEEP